MQLATKVDVFTAMDIYNNLKREEEALEVAINLMKSSNADEKHILVLKELKNNCSSRLEVLHKNFKNTQVNLY